MYVVHVTLHLYSRAPLSLSLFEQVLEETGYDAAGSASEKDCLTLYVNGQQTSMYIVTDVDEGFAFEPQVSIDCAQHP